MKRLISIFIMAVLILVPGMASAQAPAAPKDQPVAAPAAPQAQPGAAPACPMMNPEQMKQMQGQCCPMMQGGKGCPKCQEMIKKVDDLSKRVEALEKQGKGKKK